MKGIKEYIYYTSLDTTNEQILSKQIIDSKRNTIDGD